MPLNLPDVLPLNYIRIADYASSLILGFLDPLAPFKLLYYR